MRFVCCAASASPLALRFALPGVDVLPAAAAAFLLGSDSGRPSGGSDASRRILRSSSHCVRPRCQRRETCAERNDETHLGSAGPILPLLRHG